MSSIDYRVILDPDEIGKIIPVISSAWGTNSVGYLIKDTVSAMRYHGGVVIGAYDGDNMVGMHFSFPGYRKGKVYLYSHMTGVISDLKYSGIGYNIKLKQKEWALENGYDLIAWTYDPIMSLNANFNIRKIGAVARSYMNNFYGKMDDSINFGIPTDRVVAEWWIKEDRKESPAEYTPLNEFSSEYDFSFSYPDTEYLDTNVKIRIPVDFPEMKRKDRDVALKWRMYLRKLLRELFTKGYSIVGFDAKDKGYILSSGTKYSESSRETIFG